MGTRALPNSPCIRCSAFDGFPCLTNGKADAQIVCIDPALELIPNVTLLTGAYVERLETDPTGRTVTGVHVVREGVSPRSIRGDIVVSACGALSSALLMFRSTSDAHPNGLANGSDQVGRNYMRHNNAAFMAVSREPNDTIFQKTLALTDFYFGADDWEFPLGCIQTNGKSHGEQVGGRGPARLPAVVPRQAVRRARPPFAMDFWVMSEDLPRPENRITLVPRRPRDAGRQSRPAMRPTHACATSWRACSRTWTRTPTCSHRSLYLGKNIPVGGTAHQAGTLRFGTDPKSSVLDLDCRAHEVDNLYVVDAGFFPSIGAVNPTLTIVANALRVADHLAARLG